MKRGGITAHMIVKNEDQWIYYAIQSVLPYVNQFLITDTGSTDHTVEIIRSIKSKKIKFTETQIRNSSDLTKLRNSQLKETKTDWIWVVDGDEIYTRALTSECLEAVRGDYSGIVVRRYDLLGDIYHRQVETVGTYDLFGKKGHHLIRLFNQSRFPHLKYAGNYPYEDLVFGENTPLRDTDPKLWYFTKSAIYHAMYLKRSSLGGNLAMMNRSKYKIEKGIPIVSSSPEVFSLSHPFIRVDPLSHRSRVYDLLASIITPIKNFKRKFL